MTSFSERARQIREQHILDAAERVLAERGPLATIQAIAQAAGVAKGTIYLHFPSRDALVDAVLARSCERLAAFVFWENGEADDPAPADALHWVFGRLVLGLAKTANGAASRWFVLARLLSACTSPESPVFQGLTKVVEAAKERGGLAEGIASDRAAQTLFGLAIVGSVWWEEGAPSGDPRAELWQFFARGAGLRDGG